MGTVSGTSMALNPSAGNKGFPNQGPWDTTLTDVSLTAQEAVGILRQEGQNTYMYVQFGTAAIASAGLPVKPSSGLPDTNNLTAPFCCTALGATAAGYFSAIGVTVYAVSSSASYGWNSSQARYGWICVRGIGTLPLNSNTAGLAFGTPIAPSSASAGFAECAAASGVGRAAQPAGATLGTATQTAQGGIICRFDFLKSFT